MFVACQRGRGVSFKYIAILPRGESEVAFEFVSSNHALLSCIEYAFLFRYCMERALHFVA